jgi:hypothetical protein
MGQMSPSPRSPSRVTVACPPKPRFPPGSPPPPPPSCAVPSDLRLTPSVEGEHSPRLVSCRHDVGEPHRDPRLARARSGLHHGAGHALGEPARALRRRASRVVRDPREGHDDLLGGRGPRGGRVGGRPPPPRRICHGTCGVRGAHVHDGPVRGAPRPPRLRYPSIRSELLGRRPLRRQRRRRARVRARRTVPPR